MWKHLSTSWVSSYPTTIHRSRSAHTRSAQGSGLDSCLRNPGSCFNKTLVWASPAGVARRQVHQIDTLSEQQLTDYFTDLVASHSRSTVKLDLDLYGLKFYYAHVLHKPWAAPGLIKPPRTQRLPDIVTVEEARRLFAAARVVSYRVFYFTLYSLGPRPGEGLRLRVGDIDAARGRVHIRDAKGNRDRFVPLPDATHQLLQRFWQVHRNPVLLFPSRLGGVKGAATATTPMDAGGVQATLHQVVKTCGLKKDHAPPASPQLCHPPDRGTEIPRPKRNSHHRPLHPPDRPDQASRHRPHQRPDGRLPSHLGEAQMIRLAAVIDTFEAGFLAQYRSRPTADHYRALAAMKQCRTQATWRAGDWDRHSCFRCGAAEGITLGHRVSEGCEEAGFFGTVGLDPVKAKLEFADVVDEVLMKFALRSGVKIKVSVEIQAESDLGFDDGIQRAVRENCVQLKFKNSSFEE